MAEDRGATYCPEHSDTLTNLRCSRCDRLVCPGCMVQAPVGIRCREHGRPAKLPTYDVSTGFIVRGVAAGVGVGILGGLIVGLFVVLIPPFYAFYSFALVGLGYLVGEGISRATNRKRGQPLVVAAVVGVFAAYVVILWFTGLQLDLFGLLALAAAFFLAIQRVR